MIAPHHSPTQTELQFITCPQEGKSSTNTLFLAGGISNCPDWQADFAKLLSKENLTAYNPRRENFPIHDPSASAFQIDWEHRHLRASEMISFWFPKETVCPITLYELGTYVVGDKPLFVGFHPEYPYADAVIELISKLRPSLVSVRSLEELAEQVKQREPTLSILESSLSSREAMLRKIPTKPRAYLSGGIKDCVDWQAELSSELTARGVPHFNPRKKDFAPKDATELRAQVGEHISQLLNSSTVAFWFSKETFNPVALFELGVASVLSKKLYIGVEPGYSRVADIVIQTGLIRPEVAVVHSLKELAEQITIS